MYKTLPSVSARLSGTTAFSMFSVRRYMYACITRGKKHHKRLQQASRGTWGRFVHPKPVIIARLILSANFLSFLLLNSHRTRGGGKAEQLQKGNHTIETQDKTFFVSSAFSARSSPFSELAWSPSDRSVPV